MSEKHPFLVVANRLPVRRKPGGRWEPSPGGLASALTQVLREAGGAWIGWGGAAGPAPRPFSHDGIRMLPVPLSRLDLDEYYRGISNRTLWPLYHDVIEPPVYRRRWWPRYEAVNERFARRAAETAAEGAVVWIHDYHLQLAPGILRRLRPDVRIGFFLHIPFPPAELFAQLPWRREVLVGLLGADVVGFQTHQGAANFRRLCRRYADARRADGALLHEDRRVRAASFPISIDFRRFADAAASEETAARARRIRRRLGDRRVLLGVDRLDYTKGIDLRLRAYRELLEHGTRSVEDCVLVQTAVPSRSKVREYQQLRRSIDELIGAINGEHARIGNVAVQYLRRNLAFDELVTLYRAADVMLVTPRRDGMNLVAKEYVASQTDAEGALVLSEFTGAAHELKSAFLVNPHDIDGMAHTIDEALSASAKERKRRMRALRRVVQHNDVQTWAKRFLETLAP